MNRRASSLIAFLAAAALVGGGCPSPVAKAPQPPAPPSAPPESPTAPRLGFGKLPKPTTAQVLGSQKAISAVAPTAPSVSDVGAPIAAAEGRGIAGTATMIAPGVIEKPLPSPVPRPKPVTVEYTIATDLPSWGSTGDVLQAQPALPDMNIASGFARSAGLPSQAIGSGSKVTTVSLQWRDADGYSWTFDAGSRNVSFWKEQPYARIMMPETADANAAPPKIDEQAVLRAADAFLDAHGFSDIRKTGGKIQEMPWIGGMMRSDAAAVMPCPAVEAQTKEARPEATMMIEPGGTGGSGIAYPCGWWPQQVTVVYGGTLENRNVVDAGGWPAQNASISVGIRTNDVENGAIQLATNVSRSSYPLIDAETAKKRLQSGALNPVWPWGNETGTIKVTLSKISLVWMRYDAWVDAEQETYYLPALLAEGTVERGIKGQQPEEYRTVLPLVSDEAFEDVGGVAPPPVPLPAETAPAAPPVLKNP